MAFKTPSIVDTLTKNERKGIAKVYTRITKLFGENGEHWTTGDLAKNAKGRSCSPLSETAEKFCLIGAARRVDTAYESIALSVLDEIVYRQRWGNHYTGRRTTAKHPYPSNVFHFNDGTTFKSVRKVLDKAIAKVTL